MLNTTTWLDKVRHFGRDRAQARRLWGPLGRGRPVIVIPADVNNSHDPATGVGELRAAILVLLCSVTVRAKDFAVYYPYELIPPGEKATYQKLREKLAGADIFILGSSLTNPIIDVVFDALAARNPNDAWLRSSCGRGESDIDHWVSYRGGERLRTHYLGPKLPQTMSCDYGIFIVRPNPFSSKDSSARLFAFFGAHTHGTQAAADFFFSDEGASKLARLFGRKREPTWNFHLDGLVRISPFKAQDNAEEEIAMDLTLRSRHIELIAPTVFPVSRDIVDPVFNPVIGRMLSRARSSVWMGITRKVELRFLCVIAAFFFVYGLYQHHFALATGGLLLYFLATKVYEHNT